LGTILAPVFALFFPIDVAIALTGVVHFTNNLFKIALVGKYASRQVVLKFGVPAILAAFAGAWFLLKLNGLPELFQYTTGDTVRSITPVKLIVAILLIIFALIELFPKLRNFQVAGNHLILGGLLSGFFGGLTGLQGAIRSAFLIRTGLTKEAYIATGVAIACMIDLTRLSVYASRFSAANLGSNLFLLISATWSAIAGAYLGRRLLKKTTMKSIQLVVAIMLILISLALGSGLI
jgi:uncharacterized membrane protein YfcA